MHQVAVTIKITIQLPNLWTFILIPSFVFFLACQHWDETKHHKFDFRITSILVFQCHCVRCYLMLFSVRRIVLCSYNSAKFLLFIFWHLLLLFESVYTGQSNHSIIYRIKSFYSHLEFLYLQMYEEIRKLHGIFARTKFTN